MKVDAPLRSFRSPDREAERLEQQGYAGAFTFEGPHDPFFPLITAARATRAIDLYTAVAIAFARNPMRLAYVGWDLQALSEGRFKLGLGTQVKAHIVRRFGMPWSKPAARLREMTLAIKEIWRCWDAGDRLDFRGEFYEHTLSTPQFSPGKSRFGPPPIWLAGVGPRMTEVAGEVADGFLVHPLFSRRSLRELSLAALERGLAASGRKRDALEISAQVMICTGRNDEEMAKVRQATKQQIAFYGSTPTYRPALETADCGDLQPRLHAMSKQGEWAKMAELVNDDVLETFAVCGAPGEIAARVIERCGGLVDRVSLLAHFNDDAELLDDVARDLAKDEGPS